MPDAVFSWSNSALLNYSLLVAIREIAACQAIDFRLRLGAVRFDTSPARHASPDRKCHRLDHCNNRVGEAAFGQLGLSHRPPAPDSTVTAVQTQLTQLGYYSGPVDGIFGPLTRDAVAKYQMAKQLNVAGSLSPDTLQSLGLPQATPS